MATQTSEPREARKVRWTVPAVDTSVNEWLDHQADISASLRTLIRESIQRDGYIDVVYKPVEQLPRRGRPPGGENDQSRSSLTWVDEMSEPESQGHRAAAAVIHQTPVALPAEPAPTEQSAAPTAVEPAEQTESPSPTLSEQTLPQPARQASIDEIMSATRN